MGLQIDDPSITSFIAVIQVGAIAALVIYLRKDIWRLLDGLVPRPVQRRGAAGSELPRGLDGDHRLAADRRRRASSAGT